jgi:hypothetical protein
MKTTGHYWCDDCDDAAFGQICQQCNQDARFVPDTTFEPKVKESPSGRNAVTDDRARQLFNWVRQAVL